MAAPRQIPQVLVVSPARSRLRQVTRFLEMFGYPVTQAHCAEQAVVAIEAVEPSVVIVDGAMNQREYLDLCHEVRSHRIVSEAYVVLMVGNTSANVLLQATESGFDDFLAIPIVHGELLARLHAAVRLRAAARRDAGYVDSLTGLIGSETFQQHLLAAVDAGSSEISCVVCGLDFLTQVNRTQGRSAADEVIRQLATLLQEACKSEQTVGHIDGDTFAVLLPGFGAEEASRWAEQRRKELIGRMADDESRTSGVTASFGVATLQGQHADRDIAPHELLNRARQALQIAKQSGRDCVVREGEFAAEDEAISDLAAPGRMFENTVARDVMTPCPIVFQSTDVAEDALALLRRSGVPGAPITDEAGELMGFVSVEHLHKHVTTANADSAIIEMANPDATAFESKTPFSELFDFFITHADAEIVVVEGGHPVGVVTREGLTALVEPVQCRRDTPEDRRARDHQQAAGLDATAS